MHITAQNVSTTCNSTMETFSVHNQTFSAEIYEKLAHGALARSCNIKTKSGVSILSMDYDNDAGEWVATDESNQLSFIEEQDALTAAAKIMSKKIGE